MTEMNLGRVSELSSAVLDEVERAVVGKREALELVLAGILAGGHVLLEDFPGLGKTLAARSLRAGPRARLQPGPSSPPTCCPADLTGSFVYDQRAREFEFRRGPALHRTAARRRDQPHAAQDPGRAARGDAGAARSRSRARRSRCPSPSTCSRPRTRSSTRAPTRCPRPSSTGSCCASAFGYPTLDEEWDVLDRRMARPSRGAGAASRSPTPTGLLAMQAAVEARDRRRDGRPLLRGAGRGDPDPRRRAHRRLAARGARPAAVRPGVRRRRGRDYVIPEDVKAVAVPVLAHRITVKPELWMSDASGQASSRACCDRRHAVARVSTSPAPWPGRLSDVAEVAPAPNRDPSTGRVGVDRCPERPSSLAAAGAVVAVVGRRPDLLVIVAPLVVAALWGHLARPRVEVTGRPDLGDTTMREGAVTGLRVSIDPPLPDLHGIAMLAQAPWVERKPSSGIAQLERGSTTLGVRSTRWGRRRVGTVSIALVSTWGAFRAGPVDLPDLDCATLPVPASFDASAPTPHPRGHRRPQPLQPARVRVRVQHDPPVPPRGPAAAHPLARVDAHRRPARHVDVSPTRTPTSSCSSTA